MTDKKKGTDNFSKKFLLINEINNIMIKEIEANDRCFKKKK